MAMALLKYRNQYVWIQAIVLGLLTMIIYLWDISFSIPLLYFMATWNIIIYGWVLYNELVKSQNFHPFIIFALITLQYCGFSPLSTINNVITGEDIYIGSTRVNESLTLGYLYLTLEHYFIYIGYFFYDNRKLMKSGYDTALLTNITYTPRKLYNVALYNYIAVLLLRLIDKIGIPLASITSILDSYAGKGFLISLTLLSYAILLDSKRSLTKITFWLITVVEIAIVLGNGMKQEIITPLLPYMIYLIIAYKNGKLKITSPKFIVKLSFIVIFVIGFAFPYVTTFRGIAIREGKEWSEIPISQAMSEYWDNITGTDTENSKNGLETFMNRASAIACNSFSVNYTERYGHSFKYFISTTTRLIPRVIWPDKPNATVGSTATFLTMGYSYDDAIKIASQTKHMHSITLGFAGSSYMALGALGVIIFSFIAGLATAMIWHFVNKRPNDIVALWLFYNMMTTIFIDYESFIDFGVLFYAWSLIYVLIIKTNDKIKIYG